jgi:hypothetical protein
VLASTRLTARLALTRIAATESRRQTTMLYRERQPRMLGQLLDLLAPVGFVMQDDVAAAAPDVGAHRGERHLGVDELGNISMDQGVAGVVGEKYLAVAVELKILVWAQGRAVCFCLLQLLLRQGGLDTLGNVAENLAGAQHAVSIETIITILVSSQKIPVSL